MSGKAPAGEYLGLDARLLLEIISAVSELALNFHSEQNQQLRSADDASVWYVAAAKGGFMSHVSRIIGVMADVPSLQQAGMLVDGSAVERATDADEGLAWMPSCPR